MPVDMKTLATALRASLSREEIASARVRILTQVQRGTPREPSLPNLPRRGLGAERRLPSDEFADTART
jgi:hypothetical protein